MAIIYANAPSMVVTLTDIAMAFMCSLHSVCGEMEVAVKWFYGVRREGILRILGNTGERNLLRLKKLMGRWE